MNKNEYIHQVSYASKRKGVFYILYHELYGACLPLQSSAHVLLPHCVKRRAKKRCASSADGMAFLVGQAPFKNPKCLSSPENGIPSNAGLAYCPEHDSHLSKLPFSGEKYASFLQSFNPPRSPSPFNPSPMVSGPLFLARSFTALLDCSRVLQINLPQISPPFHGIPEPLQTDLCRHRNRGPTP